MNFLVRLVSIDLSLGSSYNVKIQKIAASLVLTHTFAIQYLIVPMSALFCSYTYSLPFLKESNKDL